jgi:hypothetical protein
MHSSYQNKKCARCKDAKYLASVTDARTVIDNMEQHIVVIESKLLQQVADSESAIKSLESKVIQHVADSESATLAHKLAVEILESKLLRQVSSNESATLAHKLAIKTFDSKLLQAINSFELKVVQHVADNESATLTHEQVLLNTNEQIVTLEQELNDMSRYLQSSDDALKMVMLEKESAQVEIIALKESLQKGQIILDGLNMYTAGSNIKLEDIEDDNDKQVTIIPRLLEKLVLTKTHKAFAKTKKLKVELAKTKSLISIATASALENDHKFHKVSAALKLCNDEWIERFTQLKSNQTRIDILEARMNSFSDNDKQTNKKQKTSANVSK